MKQKRARKYRFYLTDEQGRFLPGPLGVLILFTIGCDMKSLCSLRKMWKTKALNINIPNPMAAAMVNQD